MTSIGHLTAVLLLSISTVCAEYQPGDTPAAATAGTCALNCVEYSYGYNGVEFGCNGNYLASCLCNTANGHSSSMDVSISLCPTVGNCGGAPEATQGLLIFSEYCSMNLIGVSIPTVTQTGTVSTAVPGEVGITPFSTSIPSQTSSTSSNNSSSGNSNSLSTSDKIAIACAVGGALVTIAVAVPTWLHMRSKKRKENAAEAEPLHAMPQYNPHVYPNPAQQPFFAKPQPQVYYYPQQQPNRWGWSYWHW